MALSNPYIFGLHDKGGESLMQGRGWVTVTEAIGRDPNNHHGADYRDLSSLGVIVRLNNGYGSTGTIPTRHYYHDFAQRCVNFIRASSGCNKWIIGNEPNHQQEWPDGERIYPKDYAECYNIVKNKLGSLAQDHEILVAGPAPWNNQVTYQPNNGRGDWITYLQDQIRSIGLEVVDGVSIHAYTHNYDPATIHSEAVMNPPFQDRYFEFYVYRQFLQGLKEIGFSKKPIYMTECNGDLKDWPGDNGWITTMYREINAWNNREADHQIKCVTLFRWKDDPYGWSLSRNAGSMNEFRRVVAKNEYKWRPYSSEPTPEPPPSQDCKDALEQIDQELDKIGQVVRASAQDAYNAYQRSVRANEDIEALRAEIAKHK